MSWICSTQHTKVWSLWLHVQKQPYTGQSPQPSKPYRRIVTTATPWCPRNPVLHPICLLHPHTPFSVCMLISSTTREWTTSLSTLLKLTYHRMGTRRHDWLLLLHIHDVWHPQWICHWRQPEFTAAATCQFLKEWGAHHRLSSVAFPHSNCRTELGRENCQMTHHQQHWHQC